MDFDTLLKYCTERLIISLRMKYSADSLQFCLVSRIAATNVELIVSQTYEILANGCPSVKIFKKGPTIDCKLVNGYENAFEIH